MTQHAGTPHDCGAKLLSGSDGDQAIGKVTLFGLKAEDALEGQQAPDPVAIPLSFTDQGIPFTPDPASVLILDCWNPDPGQNIIITRLPGLQGTDHPSRINAVRLDLPGTAVDFEAGRINDDDLDVRGVPFKATGQPEPFISCLITQHDSVSDTTRLLALYASSMILGTSLG